MIYMYNYNYIDIDSKISVIKASIISQYIYLLRYKSR